MSHQLHSVEINRLKTLASRCEELGDYLTEYWCLKRLLEITREDCLPPSALAELLFDLGLTCAALDKIDEASRCFSRALDLYRQIHREGSFEIRECLNNLRAMDAEANIFPAEFEFTRVNPAPAAAMRD